MRFPKIPWMVLPILAIVATAYLNVVPGVKARQVQTVAPTPGSSFQTVTVPISELVADPNAGAVTAARQKLQSLEQEIVKARADLQAAQKADTGNARLAAVLRHGPSMFMANGVVWKLGPDGRPTSSPPPQDLTGAVASLTIDAAGNVINATVSPAPAPNPTPAPDQTNPTPAPNPNPAPTPAPNPQPAPTPPPAPQPQPNPAPGVTNAAGSPVSSGPVVRNPAHK